MTIHQMMTVGYDDIDDDIVGYAKNIMIMFINKLLVSNIIYGIGI